MKQNRYAPLDGLRAIAILLVILFHTNEFLPNLPAPIKVFFWSGWNGVSLFFVLSGFLIGNLIFSEVQKTGGLNLGRFWLRRMFRTWPLYFILFTFLYYKSPVKPPLIPYLTFTQNIFTDSIFFGPTWSLAIEEQFYFFFPLLILLVLKLRKFQLMPFISLAGIALAYLYRGIYGGGIHSFANVDCLWFGILISYLHPQKTRGVELLTRNSNIVFFLSLACIYLPYFFLPQNAVRDSVYLGTSSIGFALILLCCLSENFFLSRVLSSKILAWIGMVSYSIYLFQHRSIWRSVWIADYLKLQDGPLRNCLILSLAIGLSVLYGSILYYIIEKPFLLIRDRYFPRVV